MQPDSNPSRPTTWLTVAAVLAPFAGVLTWVFWPSFGDMADKWVSDPQYSHGYLVPLFSIGYLVWRRRQLDLAVCRVDWRGLVLIAVSAVGYVAGGYFFFDWLSAGSFLLALGGVTLLLGGTAALRWAGPAIAFLGFMIPLPYQVETALGQPLQRLATRGSTWVLQTCGFPAISEGTVIVLEHGRVAVVEACNGLSMLMIFLAISTAMAMVIRRPVIDRIIVVASALPVALAANIARISANGVGIEVWDVETAHKVFHDQGGWLMMPLAVCMLWVELWVLRKLFVETPAARSVPIGGAPAAVRRPAAAAS
jgi:exosortase